MNTKLITQTFIGPVNIPYRRRRVEFARQPRFNGEQISRAGRIEKGITQAVRSWFVRSSDKDGQSLNNGEMK